MFKPLLVSLTLVCAALGASAQAKTPVPTAPTTATTAASAPASAPAPSKDAQPAPPKLTWQLATPGPDTGFQAENLKQFAQEVEKASEGRLKIDIQPDAALKAPALRRAVAEGKSALGALRLADLQAEWPVFGLDSVPFLAGSYAQAWKLYQAQRVPLGKKLSGQGLVMLYSVPSPPPGLLLKAPVAKLTELRGLAWAAYSPATERMAQLLGAQAVKLDEARVAQAAAQGQVQAALVSAEGFDADAFGRMPVYLDLQAWLPRHALLMNLKAFEQLDPAARKAVVKAAIAVEQRGWKLSEARHQRFLEQLKELGLTVEPPSAALRTGLLKTVGEPLLDDWLQRSGAEGKRLIEDYRR